MPYDAAAIANHFLDLADRYSNPVSPMKLQKLVYIAHGWHLAFTDRPLIKEAVEAWDYGPVIPSLYQEFKHYGNGAITSKAARVHGSGMRFFLLMQGIDDYPDHNENVYAKKLLNKVWEIYGNYTAIQLSNLTHRSNSPWDKARREHGHMKNIQIPEDVIREHYVALKRANEQSAQAKTR